MYVPNIYMFNNICCIKCITILCGLVRFKYKLSVPILKQIKYKYVRVKL